MRLFELMSEGKVKDFLLKRSENPDYHPELFRSHVSHTAEPVDHSEGHFGINVHGKLWLKKGTPISFKTYDLAKRMADRVGSLHRVDTQVVPLDKFKK